MFWHVHLQRLSLLQSYLPGKTDHNKPNSYRTITLSPTLLKLQEKVVLWHMQHDLGMEDSLSKKQYGFKKGTSIETALHKVIHKIEKRIAKKGYVLGTFLDIEGAFDNVSFKAISEAIDQSPLDSATAGWIKNMVTNRQSTCYHISQKLNQTDQNQKRMSTLHRVVCSRHSCGT